MNLSVQICQLIIIIKRWQHFLWPTSVQNPDDPCDPLECHHLDRFFLLKDSVFLQNLLDINTLLYLQNDPPLKAWTADLPCHSVKADGSPPWASACGRLGPLGRAGPPRRATVVLGCALGWIHFVCAVWLIKNKISHNWNQLLGLSLAKVLFTFYSRR